MKFADRAEAGRILAAKLVHYARRGSVLVLALPRGGVPVAFEVARALDAPLDVLVVRKVGVPGHEELAMGAVASGHLLLDEETIRSLGIAPEEVERAVEASRKELDRRISAYRDGRQAPRIAGRSVLVVDDGLATGASMRAAVAALRRLAPQRIVAAVPVGAPDACAQLRADVDELVCARTPEPFYAVGAWYEHFPQTSDAEVRRCLAQTKRADTVAG